MNLSPCQSLHVPSQGFNPHRPRRAGEPPQVCVYKACAAVSIRTGPEGPVNRRPARRCRRARGSFNPHRPRRAGEPGAGPQRTTRISCFNPHRPRRAGEPRVLLGLRMADTSFNPHRPRRAGEPVPLPPFGDALGVSIRTGPEGPVNPVPCVISLGQRAFQSAPAPKGR